MKSIQRWFIVSVFSVSIISGLGGRILLPEAALAQTSDPVFVGAGDISNCGRTEDESTAQLLDNIAGTVFTLGDNVYPDGTMAQFNDCHGPPGDVTRIVPVLPRATMTTMSPARLATMATLGRRPRLWITTAPATAKATTPTTWEPGT